MLLCKGKGHPDRNEFATWPAVAPPPHTPTARRRSSKCRAWQLYMYCATLMKGNWANHMAIIASACLSFLCGDGCQLNVHKRPPELLSCHIGDSLRPPVLPPMHAFPHLPAARLLQQLPCWAAG